MKTIEKRMAGFTSHAFFSHNFQKTSVRLMKFHL